MKNRWTKKWLRRKLILLLTVVVLFLLCSLNNQKSQEITSWKYYLSSICKQLINQCAVVTKKANQGRVTKVNGI